MTVRRSPVGRDRKVVDVQWRVQADLQRFVHRDATLRLQLIYVQLACAAESAFPAAADLLQLTVEGQPWLSCSSVVQAICNLPDGGDNQPLK